jgi:hypothetical protein
MMEVFAGSLGRCWPRESPPIARPGKISQLNRSNAEISDIDDVAAQCHAMDSPRYSQGGYVAAQRVGWVEPFAKPITLFRLFPFAKIRAFIGNVVRRILGIHSALHQPSLGQIHGEETASCDEVATVSGHTDTLA